MEHNIKELFKVDDFPKKEIPKNHRNDFLNKLELQHKKQNGFQRKNIFKIAVSVVTLLFCTLYYFNTNKEISKTTLQIQVAEIEKEYLTNIDKEWENFIEVAEDSILVSKYKIKMHDFDKDYQKITNQLEKTPNNINVLEALISNLQRRLELIKNIKEHIKELNQKNTNNETIFI